MGDVPVGKLFRATFNVLSGAGCLILIGIVVNNAIVLVDYANTLRGRGIPLREAVVQAGAVRLNFTRELVFDIAAIGGAGGRLGNPIAEAVLARWLALAGVSSLILARALMHSCLQEMILLDLRAVLWFMTALLALLLLALLLPLLS